MLSATMLHVGGQSAPFSPCGRRWREAPDEGSRDLSVEASVHFAYPLSASRDPSSGPPSAVHLLPQGEKGRARRLRVRNGCVPAFSMKTKGGGMPDIREKTLRARMLRRDMTDAERALWYLLRSRRFSGFKFRRQVPVGPYVADFLCFDRRIVVECDGSQHAENLRDARRDAWLAANGFRTLRFWNHDVLRSRDAVADTLFAALSSDLPS